MRRVLYVLISYFGFCAFMCVLLAVGKLADWLHDRRDRHRRDGRRTDMTRSWTEQRSEIRSLPEVEPWQRWTA